MARPIQKKGMIVSLNLTPLALEKLNEMVKTSGLNRSELVSSILESQETLDISSELQLENVRRDLKQINSEMLKIAKQKEELENKEKELVKFTKYTKKVQRYIRPQVETAITFIVEAMERKVDRLGLENIAMHQSRKTGVSPQELLNLALERMECK